MQAGGEEIFLLKESLGQHTKSVKVLILIFTLAIATLGAMNFAAQWNSKPVTDGVKWIFFRGVVVADTIASGSAGDDSGIQKGDQISAINLRKVRIPQDVGAIAEKEMAANRPLQYDLVRGDESFVVLSNAKTPHK